MIAVINFVKEAIGRFWFAFLSYKILPVFSQITTADGEDISIANILLFESSVNNVIDINIIVLKFFFIFLVTLYSYNNYLMSKIISLIDIFFCLIYNLLWEVITFEK